MLGWRILPEGEYRIEMPQLSEDEERMVEVVEERFKEVARLREMSNKEEILEAIKETLQNTAGEEGIYLDSDQEEYLSKVAYHHIYGFAFIDELLKDGNIEEISIVGLGKPAYVYIRKQGWKKVNAAFTDEKTLMDVINKMAKTLGRRITLQNPRLDTMLPDGSRLHASLPPISDGEITIRRFRDRPFSPKEIVELKTASVETMALLSLLMQSDSSILIAGNTASGKTTTMNAIFSFVPLNERILITEETPEINIPHAHKVRMVANKEMGVSLMDLVYDSLRMRPDRIVVGEVRNKEEARALVDVLLGGQARGAYATFHAQSAQEALLRLESFGISEMDLNSIDAILVQRRMLIYDLKQRKNVEVRRVVELSMVENAKAVPVIKYNAAKDAWEEKGIERIFPMLSEKLGIEEKEVEKEYVKRKKEIEKAPIEFNEFFASVQKGFYGLEK
ncbi:MAG: ATPase, T2SS/T4P/T4SS family [Candidatus Anstonellales archaeon]